MVEHPATPEKLQEEPEPEENHENEAEPNNETAGNYVITVNFNLRFHLYFCGFTRRGKGILYE